MLTEILLYQKNLFIFLQQKLLIQFEQFFYGFFFSTQATIWTMSENSEHEGHETNENTKSWSQMS